MGERSRGAYGRKYVISSRALFTSVRQFSYFVLGKISSIWVSQYLGPLLDLINVKTGRCLWKKQLTSIFLRLSIFSLMIFQIEIYLVYFSYSQLQCNSSIQRSFCIGETFFGRGRRFILVRKLGNCSYWILPIRKIFNENI